MTKILVVDNDKFILEFMNDVLSERGHEVVTAEGGLPAVDILKTYTPDIVFVDLVMPNIEGKQLCKIIRGMPELKDVAMVILSAIATEEGIKIEEFKADACIAKGPVKEMAKQIVEIVDKLAPTSLSGLPGVTTGVPGVYSRNITKELLSIKNHFQIILGKISEGVLEVTSAERIVYANSIALSIIEIPEEKLLGSHFIDLFADDDHHRVAELMKPSGDKPQITTEEFPLRLNEHQVTLQFLPINEYAATSLVILNDITECLRAKEEKKQLEAQLHQSQRLKSLGTLAGGIAHEFNNALMGIIGNIELLKMDLPEDEGRDKYFETMKSSGHRMSRLTDQLLAYAQGGKYQPKNLKLDDFVIETLPILQHDLSPEVRVKTHFPKDISHIRADQTQMQMLLSAILANSNEAIGDEGLIKITAGNKDLDEDFTKQHYGFKPGPYVYLTIEDDGKGMDEETRKGIFDPFFTTKFQGRGMGMAAVYGIVMNHDGWISVASELGQGTTVRIYLPAIEMEVEKPKKAKAKVEIATGSGTILMVEDEDVVIEVTQAMLERLGYRVMVAKTGKDAIHITETFDGHIDLALLDIKLPDMEGGKVYPLIMEARPDLKVIVCSGYSIEGPARKILDAGAQDFIQKPFSLAALSEILKKVLE